MKIECHIEFHGEQSAGLLPYSENITVQVDSDDPGGEAGEFAEELRQFLTKWYEGATVECASIDPAKE